MQHRLARKLARILRILPDWSNPDALEKRRSRKTAQNTLNCVVESDAAGSPQRRMFGRLLNSLVHTVLAVCILAALAVCALIFVPDSPLPKAWNPREPLVVSDPVTPLTGWKLNRALADKSQCLAVLASSADFDPMPDFVHSDLCHIRDQVALRRVAGLAMSQVNTRCQIALRSAMWAQHGIEPAARAHFGVEPARLNHLSSYNCRPMRTARGTETRMSTHATANSIDITGVTLADGRRINLLSGWNGDDAATRAFLRDIRDSACTWFRTTLGPEYNRLHADHFHLQHTGWGTCR